MALGREPVVDRHRPGLRTVSGRPWAVAGDGVRIEPGDLRPLPFPWRSRQNVPESNRYLPNNFVGVVC